MSIIKKYSPLLGLSRFETFIVDDTPTSEFFRVSEMKDTLSGGKNGFLIAGHPQLRESTEVKIEVLDVEGNPVYVEPGSGIPEYYEGTSTLISIHVYDDTPIGMGKITILGELKETWSPDVGFQPVPDEWKGTYNVKWEKEIFINKLVNNEDRVRFYKRPLVNITEINKPLFSISTPIISQSGSLVGIAQTPDTETSLDNWRAGTLYQLRITDGSNFSSSIDENVINIPSLGYSPTIKEVLNNKEALVEIPYTVNNVVQNFATASYNSQFEYIEGQTLTNSALEGSFAQIKINQLKTFVGDVARVKIYAKSRNETGDFQLLQDAKLESTELLRDLTIQSDTEISFGKFTEANIENYWMTSSASHPISLNVDKLQNSVFVDYGGAGSQKFETKDPITITEDIEYTIDFKYLFNGTTSSTKTLKAYLSSSDDIYTFGEITSDDTNTVRTKFNNNLIANKTSDMKLVIEATGDDWYFSDVSLRNADDTSFSPDEFILVNSIPRKLGVETFDFKFEFYDINNNFIPVDVTTSKVFDGGNLTDAGGGTYVLLTADKTAFRFASGSIGNPLNQIINLDVQLNETSGSTIWTSGAYDNSGTLLTGGDYPGGGYPGLLTSVDDYNATLSIGAFTGSESGIEVSTITYTATVDGVEGILSIGKYQDGLDISTLLVKSDRNQFYYDDGTGDLTPTGQEINMRAERKNLSATNNEIIATSGSGIPQLTVVSDFGGIRTYNLPGSSFPYATGEQTYTFTSDDQYGNTFTDAVTVTPVLNSVGATGSFGTDAKVVKLTAPFYAIVYDKNGENPQTSSMYVTASAQNLTTPFFKFTGDGVVDDVSYTVGTGDFDYKQFTIPSTYFTTPMDVRVGVADGNQSELAYDTINIYAVRPGDDGLSTEFWYIKPKNGTQIKNNTGSLELQAMWSSGSVLTELSSGDYQLYNEGGILSVGGGVTAGANGVTYNAILDPTAINGQSVISLKSGSVTFDTVTLVDVTDGLAAGSIIANTLLTRRDSGSATYTPEFLYATASFYGSLGSEYLEYLTIDPFYSSSEQLDYMSWSLQLNNPNITVAVNDGDFGNVPENVYSATKDMNVVFTFTDPTQNNSITTAQETFYIISDGQDGADSFTIFLTNEAHTFPADETAWVAPGDLSDGSFEVRCFKGITQFTTGSGVDTYSITNIIESGITGSFTDNGGQAKYTPSEVNQGVISGTVTFTVHSNTENLDFDKTYSFGKSIKGIDGFGSEFFYIKPLNGTQIKNSTGTLELQAVQVSGSTISDITSGTVQMYSGSTLLTIGDGVTDGGNGVTYNPVFDSSAISGSLVITLKDGATPVDTITLVDVGDGIPSGTVLANSLHTRRVSNETTYTPTTLNVTASFYNALGTEFVEYLTLSASYIDPTDYWSYVIDSDNANITLICNDGDGTTFAGEGIGNKLPTKDINTLFTFTDPITLSQITAQETFYIVSDGIDGATGASGSAGIDGVDGDPGPSGSDGIDGTDGTDGLDAEIVRLSATKYTVPYDQYGDIDDGTNITFTATEQNIASAQFQFYRNGGIVQSWSVTSTYVYPTSNTIPGPSNSDLIQVDVRSGTGATLAFDTADVAGVQNGTTGPGIVHTGVWDTSTTYQWSDTPGNSRRDSVLYSGTYYATLQPAGISIDIPPNEPTYWESLGTGDLFVASKIAIFEDSYVQNVLNIGTTSTTFNTANITLNGGSTSPYFSLGQATAGVYGATGIYIGRDAGSYKMSIGNFSTPNYIRYNGSTIEIDTPNFSIDSGGNVAVAGSITVGTTTLTDNPFLDDTATNNDVGLGNVSNLSPVNQAQTGLIVGTTITGGGITITTGGRINAGKTTAASTTKGFWLGHDGTSNYDFHIGDATNSLWWDGSANSLTIKGSITGGSLSIGSANNILRVATDGDLWIGHATQGSAPFQVTKAGVITATSGTIGGWTIASTTLKSSNSRTTLDNDGSISLTDGTDEKVLITQGTLSSTTFAETAAISTEADGGGTFDASSINKTYSQTYTVSSNTPVYTTEFTPTTANFSCDIAYPTPSGSSFGEYQLDAISGFAVNNIKWESLAYYTMELQQFNGSWAAVAGQNKQITIFKETRYTDDSAANLYQAFINYTSGHASKAYTGVAGRNSRFRMVRTHSMNMTVYTPENASGITLDYTARVAGWSAGTLNLTVYEVPLKTEIGANGMTIGSDGGYMAVGPVASTQAGSSVVGLFLGDVLIRGQLAVSYVTSASDERLKTGITPLTDGLDKINALSPVDFLWNNVLDSNEKRENSFGFIAQEVEKTLPNVVEIMGNYKDYKDIKSLDYNSLTALSISAIQELSIKMDDMQKKIYNLETQISSSNML